MPFVTSKNPVYSRALINNLLSALDTIPGAALLVTPFVHLYTAQAAAPSQDSVPGDFTEATFTGYAATALTLPLLGPLNADSEHSAVHNEVDYLAGAVTPPGESILGYWIDEAAAGGATFYFGEQFASPIQISALGDFISLDVLFPLPWQESLA